MRNLNTEELKLVYGGGSKGCHGRKKGHGSHSGGSSSGSKSRGGSSSGSKGSGSGSRGSKGSS